jgi:hypothetical protein
MLHDGPASNLPSVISAAHRGWTVRKSTPALAGREAKVCRSRAAMVARLAACLIGASLALIAVGCATVPITGRPPVGGDLPRGGNADGCGTLPRFHGSRATQRRGAYDAFSERINVHVRRR